MFYYCETKGYFNRIKKPLPVIVRNIAIVTTKNSTIESDITKQIGINPSFIDAYRFNGKADDLSALLKTIISKNRYDIICLYRGGREDEFMFVFSDPVVIDQVVKSQVPVVSALGHERDVPPIQLVVDAGFASPSKFATSIRHRNEAAFERAQKYTKDIPDRLIKLYPWSGVQLLRFVHAELIRLRQRFPKTATA